MKHQVTCGNRRMHGEELASTDACSCLGSEICHASGILSRWSLFEPGVTFDMHGACVG